jgi:hypothetical protein
MSPTAAVQLVREGLGSFDPSASTSVAGEDHADVNEVFAPRHHTSALDPSTTLVLGARGAGKSFWASVLNQDTTRALADVLYPQLGLANLRTAIGFSGAATDLASRDVIDARVPAGEEDVLGRRLWRAVVARHALEAAGRSLASTRISALIDQFADPEDWQEAMAEADAVLAGRGQRLLVLFDALDALAIEWDRLRRLMDGLMEVAWSLRGYRAIRAKLFVRPDQLDELNLRFVELSKMRAGAARLVWEQTDLFGMMFARLAFHDIERIAAGFRYVLQQEGLPQPPRDRAGLRTWSLAEDREEQERLFVRMAGPYMGADRRKGRTYDWPINHLADGLGEVTPRSFLILVQRAAEKSSSGGPDENRMLAPSGIQEGLRAASRVRIDQLGSEYPWIRRVLQPLAQLRVPNEPSEFYARWDETETIQAARKVAKQANALPPVPEGVVSSGKGAQLRAEVVLAERLVRMGVLTVRDDGRFDMPDLFRIGARLLRKGGVAPKG